jgi:hypothetical protein
MLVGRGRMGKRSRAVANRRGGESPQEAPQGAPGRPERPGGGREGAQPPVGRPPAQQAAAVSAVRSLRAAQRRRLAADRDIVRSVAALRAAGASWHVVGQALGLTAEGARKRYGGKR